MAAAFDLKKAIFVRSFNAGSFNLQDLFFKDDGTKMFLCDHDAQTIKEYALSTAWDISTASNTANLVLAGDKVRALAFKPDGTKMYLLDNATDRLREYDLSTAWLVTSATFLQESATAIIQTNGGENTPQGLHFKSDGTKAYITGSDNTGEYNLGTAWNATTLSFVQSGRPPIESTTCGILKSDDGTKFYGRAGSGVNIKEFLLGTPFTFSSVTLNFTLDISADAPAGSIQGLFFDSTGTRLFVAIASTKVLQYQLIALPTAKAVGSSLN